LRVLVIGGRPFEVEACCGGTLSLLGKDHEITIAHVTSGNLSQHDIDPWQTSNKLAKEAAESAQILDCSLTMLEQSDFTVGDDPVTTLQLVELIRSIKPEILFTHNPCSRNSDHKNIAQQVLKAGEMSTVNGVEGGPTLLAPPAIFAIDALPPNSIIPDTYVDISSVLDTKKDALSTFESTQNHADLHNKMEPKLAYDILSAYRGLEACCHHAEGFRQLTGSKVTRLLP